MTKDTCYQTKDSIAPFIDREDELLKNTPAVQPHICICSKKCEHCTCGLR